VKSVPLSLSLLLFGFSSSNAELSETTTSPAGLAYLALGDSYTIGHSVSEDERWPSQLRRKLAGEGITIEVPEIIARTGWTTGDLITAIEQKKPGSEYDLVSLLIGVNNQYQNKSIEQYETEFTALLQTAIKLARGDKGKVFVVSIPDYGFTPFGSSWQKTISRKLDAFNAVCRKVTEANAVKWFNLTDISRSGLKDAALVAGDGLHPSARQYGLWVERLYAHVATMVSEQSKDAD
jgi:acyl-CoA thioesterase-1